MSQLRRWWARFRFFREAGLLERVRLIFMALGVANVAATFSAALLGGAPAPVRALSCVASLAVGISNWRVLRVRRSGAGLDVLTAVAMVVASLALPDATMTVSLAFSAIMFRALYGSHRGAALRLALYLCAYTAALLLAGSQGRLTSAPAAAVLQPAPAVVLSTVAMRLLYVAVGGREKAARRQEVLARAATALLEAADRQAVSTLAWRSQAELIDPGDDTVAWLLARAGDHFEVRGGTRDGPAGHAPRSALLDGVLDSSERQPLTAQGELPELALLAPRARHWVLIPTAAGEARAQVLVLASPSPIDGDLVVSSQMLMRQTALAISAIEHRDGLRWQAWHDGLTQLPNRRYFLERLTAACAVPERAEQIALLFIDLDGFKAVNDAQGHRCGDEVLVATAGRLMQATREGDLVARLGGDEFAVLVHRAGDPRIAEDLAQRLEQEIEAPITLGNGTTVSVGASIGVHRGGGALGADGLLHAADTAMYRMKATRQGAGQRRALLTET